MAPGLVRRAHEIVRLLKRKKLRIVTAESCTGGLIAAALSQAPGAAEVLEGGFVTYSKAQKSTALGVNRAQLTRHGAVTAAVARRMAEGALARSAAQVAIAVTGVLGPKVDEDGNPVGLVYFGCARRRARTQVVEHHFPRLSYGRLRIVAVMTAFALIDAAVRK